MKINEKIRCFEVLPSGRLRNVGFSRLFPLLIVFENALLLKSCSGVLIKFDATEAQLRPTLYTFECPQTTTITGTGKQNTLQNLSGKGVAFLSKLIVLSNKIAL